MDEEAPSGVNPRIPNMARMYDYALGGKDNFAADREAVQKLFAMSPENRYVPLANRRFLRRAVRYAVEQGIEQFLDLGAGLPSQGNVHEVASRARVVYVDHDPVVAVHARALLATDESRVSLVQGDLREPETILKHPEVVRLIDFSRPVAVLFVSVLHGVADAEDPAGLVRAYARPLAPGSHLILSHLTREGHPAELVRRKEEVFARSNTVFSYRGRAEILSYFEGFELVEPGLTAVTAWRPDDPVPDADLEAAGSWWLGGVGRRAEGQ
ncbi:SAM-dependent methyltransferase [Nonomuraea sp. NPDC050328]|uniref:SAM-dependent methyltransferase n=1 Tax=Nonomuraea sp. NPDC050328 TaxID=3364361 RepID=UPI0037A6E26A